MVRSAGAECAVVAKQELGWSHVSQRPDVVREVVLSQWPQARIPTRSYAWSQVAWPATVIEAGRTADR